MDALAELTVKGPLTLSSSVKKWIVLIYFVNCVQLVAIHTLGGRYVGSLLFPWLSPFGSVFSVACFHAWC